MSFLDFLFKKKKEQSVEERTFFTDALQFNSYSSYQNNRALLLSAVYRCVDTISCHYPISIQEAVIKGTTDLGK